MTLFILFVVLIIIVFWINRLSNRIQHLENFLSNKQPFSQEPSQPPFAVSEPASQEPPPVPVFIPKTPHDEKHQVELAAGWSTKIGIVAIIIGVGFFLKYAFDQGWINEITRVIMGFAAGALLLAIGKIWLEKYRGYALSLSGGGLALLYFSVFAAYQFYDLIGQGLGGILMAAITILGAGFAINYRSAELGVLAAIGGYISPLLLHSGRDQQIPLLVYLSILNLGVGVVILRYYFQEMLLVSSVGTFLVFGLWASTYSRMDNTFASIMFLNLFLIIYFVFSVFSFKQAEQRNVLPQHADRLLGVFLGLTGTAVILSTLLLMSPDFADVLPFVLAFEAVVALVTYAISKPAKTQIYNSALVLVAALALVLATAAEFDGKALAYSYLLLGLLGIMSGFFWKKSFLRGVGMSILVISLTLALIAPYGAGPRIMLFNEKFALLFFEVLVFGFISALYRKVEVEPHEKEMWKIPRLVAILLLWFAVSWDVVEYFQGVFSANGKNLFLSLWWIIYGVSLLAIGLVKKDSTFRQSAIFVLLLSILKVFLYDAQVLETGYRIVSFIVLGFILLSLSYFYNRNKEKINAFLVLSDKEAQSQDEAQSRD